VSTPPPFFTCPYCGERTWGIEDIANSYCPCCGGPGLPKDCEHRPLFRFSSVPPECDFCSAPNPAWEYPCPPIRHPDVPFFQMSGEWAACDDCVPFIEAGDYDGLFARNLGLVRARMGVDDLDTPSSLPEVWAMFAAKRGAKQPYH